MTDLVRIEPGKLLARRRAGFKSKRLNPLCEAGRLYDLHQLSIEPVEDWLRRTCRCVEASPKRAEKPGPSQLHCRRHVRKQSQAAFAHDRQRAELARRDQSQGVRN